ncbi:MAG TPA: cysteine desulfurase family protein [Thermoanaerobaculia bacterium]|jgi:cysteine desulfurase|nr:cysteine desulfurase family protein [Thermoanaerobaculia bacterium]
MRTPIYLDHNATTPLHPRVRDAMLPWLGGGLHGNPSSHHGFGQQSRDAVENARNQVASLVGGRAQEIVFTASGTEANNAVIFHIARQAERRGHLAVSAIEHPSVREAASRLAGEGMAVTWVTPREDGVVPLEEVVRALRSDTRLVALMLANNELGTLQPVATVAGTCRKQGVPVLCDAVQAVGKIPVNAPALGVDYLVLGAHKFNGPQGAAAIWVRPGAELSGYLIGGAQEGWRRAGTENVAAIVGFGAAAALAQEEIDLRHAFLAGLRDRFEEELLRRVPGAILHCQGSPRLPHTSHIAFPGVMGESLLIRLDRAGFAVSTGSACSSGSTEPSKTVLALGVSRQEALASLRVSFGITNRPDEVDVFLDVLTREVAESRKAMAWVPPST